MKQIKLEFSLEELAIYGFPLPLARLVKSLLLLSMTVKEFSFVCLVSREALPSARTWVREAPRSIRVEILERRKDGSETWLVRGLWRSPRTAGRRAPGQEALRVLQAMVRRRVEPGSSLALELTRDRLRVSMAARESEIPRIAAVLQGLGIRFRVSKVGRLTPRGGTPMDSLTPQQLRVLQLAYQMGYYAVPREATTEQLARRLGMDRGTVGEHLRRAERRIMASLFAEPK